MSVGDALASFLLQPTGKVEALVRIVCVDDESFTLDVDEGWGDVVLTRLQRFKIRVKINMSVQSRSCIAYRACAGEQIELALSAWRGDGTSFDVIETDVKPVANIRQGSQAEYEESRVRTGWPVMGRDLTNDMIPSETGILECAVSFTKGCYPGQELVERMDSRGSTAPRMLRVIHATPESQVGEEIILDGAVVGKYTSVAGEVALALIKRGVEITRL